MINFKATVRYEINGVPVECAEQPANKKMDEKTKPTGTSVPWYIDISYAESMLIKIAQCYIVINRTISMIILKVNFLKFQIILNVFWSTFSSC